MDWGGGGGFVHMFFWKVVRSRVLNGSDGKVGMTPGWGN